MWMMGCSDVPESFNGRKVRPLIPKPSSTTTNNVSNPNLPYLNRVHGNDFLHHLGGEQNKRDFNVPTTALVSSRWNPTPEQLQTLEELYRRGTRTPSADQIQHITAQLRRYGKIEGKNVFYWFQNHKARERQKRRRRSESKEDQQQLHTQSLENKESGSSRTSFEVEQQAKNWGFPTVAEESVSMQRAEISERIQFEEAQVQQRRLVDRQPTWQMMQVSCSPSTTTPIFSTTITPPLLNPNPTFINTHHFNIFLKPQRQHEDQENGSESHTLELFPLRKGEERGSSNVPHKEDESSKETINNTNITTPHQFFEFL